MPLPIIADVTPAVLELKEGEEYWWCQCGASNNQPFCDGSHAGTTFEPIKLVVERTKNYALCRCKRSGKMPFCDGAHSKL